MAITYTVTYRTLNGFNEKTTEASGPDEATAKTNMTNKIALMRVVVLRASKTESVDPVTEGFVPAAAGNPADSQLNIVRTRADGSKKVIPQDIDDMSDVHRLAGSNLVNPASAAVTAYATNYYDPDGNGDYIFRDGFYKE